VSEGELTISVPCFFSNRRRDTSFKCDWSSDVCSSDLAATEIPQRFPGRGCEHRLGRLAARDQRGQPPQRRLGVREPAQFLPSLEIGRASCRERVWRWFVRVGVTRKGRALSSDSYAGPS